MMRIDLREKIVFGDHVIGCLLAAMVVRLFLLVLTIYGWWEREPARRLDKSSPYKGWGKKVACCVKEKMPMTFQPRSVYNINTHYPDEHNQSRASAMNISNGAYTRSLPRLHRLPISMVRTIGRTDEIASASALLCRDDVRLVTLTGPGGVGKTRLGLEVAQNVQDAFRDGIFFVSLAPLREPEQLLAAIARASGIEEASDQPLSQRLKAYLGERQLLLLLDNFEHILPAGSLVADLLQTSPQLKVLATSREMLHLYGEHEVEVLPLALPDLTPSALSSVPSMIASSAAVDLFVERARAVKPSFELTPANIQEVAAICIHLDGLPLAIELAAARIKLLSPQAIRTRLHNRLKLLTGGSRDLPARQQTLRNTLDWSYDLLNETEQCFFRRLGQFVGSWTLEAAECVTADSEVREDAFELLTSLVDKSLVRPIEDTSGENRFMLLETIREYALDCLERHNESCSTQRKHIEFYISLAEEAEEHLQGREQHPWLQRLDRDSSNLWAAMRRVIEQREGKQAMRLAAALIEFLQLRSSLSEGRNWFEEVLALEDTPGPDMLRARVLYGAGLMARMHSDLVLARQRLTASKTMAQAVGDQRTRAYALGVLALLELYPGNYATAHAYVEEAMQAIEQTEDRRSKGILYRIYGNVVSKQGNFAEAQTRYFVSLIILREIGDLRSQADSFVSLGYLMRMRGKLKTAHFLFGKGFQLFQELGDRWGQLTCLNCMGDVLLLQGSYGSARTRFEEGLVLVTALGDKAEQATALTGLGEIAFCQGDLAQATRYFKDALHLAREISNIPGLTTVLHALGNLERIQGEYTSAISYYEQCHAFARSTGDRLMLIGSLFGLGEVARAQGDYIRASTLLKQSLHLSWEIGNRLSLSISLEAMIRLCKDVGLLEQAAQLWGSAQALRDELQTPVPPLFQAEYAQEEAHLRLTLGEAAFNENIAVGRSMLLKQVMSNIALIHISEQMARTAVATASRTDTITYPAGLTAREVDVLRLLADGLPDARIAQTLVISPRTVNTHLRSIYAKIGVSSRSSATRFAFEQKLV